MRTPPSGSNLLLVLASALLLTGCASLPGLSYVGPYQRTPSGIWVECRDACDTPEPLLPEVPGTGGRSGTAFGTSPNEAMYEINLGNPLPLPPPSLRLPTRMRNVPLGPSRFEHH